MNNTQHQERICAKYKSRSFSLNMPTIKNRYEQTVAFYAAALGFSRESEADFYLRSSQFPCAGLDFQLEKNLRAGERCYLILELDDNLPSVCNDVARQGIAIELISDAARSWFCARLNDPSGNLIQVGCATLYDQFNATFKMLTLD